MDPSLAGKTAIITGANQGLGFQIAKQYLEAGAGAVICARNAASLQQARQELLRFCQPGQQIKAEPGDVSKVADVERIVQATRDEFGRIDILVNNAAIHGPNGASDEVDWQEWVHAVEVNLFGSVLMCRAVVPYLKAQGYGKIVQLSGGGATNPMPRISAYAASKAAVIRFIETLAEEVRDYHVDVNAIAPGPLNTRMLDEVLEAGPDKVGNVLYERALEQKRNGGASLENAAALAVFLGSGLSDGITGKLISAVWDPWRNLPEHLDDLRSTDIYTLRRIVPGDRGREWENDR